MYTLGEPWTWWTQALVTLGWGPWVPPDLCPQDLGPQAWKLLTHQAQDQVASDFLFKCQATSSRSPVCSLLNYNLLGALLSKLSLHSKIKLNYFSLFYRNPISNWKWRFSNYMLHRKCSMCNKWWKSTWQFWRCYKRWRLQKILFWCQGMWIHHLLQYW